MIGQDISRYKIVSKLGAGASSEVYLANDAQLDRNVAIKILQGGLFSDAEARRRFLSEAQALAQLKHPSIQTIFDFGTYRDRDFLVMEYFAGTDLRETLVKGPLSQVEAVKFTVMLADALAAAHRSGILHRDLKPENVWIGTDTRARLLDFGLATRRFAETRTDHARDGRGNGLESALFGTLPYIAPELLQGGPADARSDLYSLGCVLFEMLTGSPPFVSATANELTEQILHLPAPSPSVHRPEVSAVLSGITERCLRKNPDERYASADELRADLEHALPAISQPSPPSMPHQSQTPRLEMSYVLFMDIVGYSRLATDTQQDVLRRLQRVVRATAEFRQAERQNRLVSLPTGDGMALAFFTQPESPAQCALAIARALKAQPDIPLRMGLHAGPVFRVADINAHQNVAGEGINVAQRVMDAGDAGHILVSKSLADVLRQLTGWQGMLRDLGEVTVKHGLRIHVFNLLSNDAGNPASPKKLTDQKSPAPRPDSLLASRTMRIAAVALIVLAGLATIFFRQGLFVVNARRPKIAVLGFNNLTAAPGSNWVSSSLESMLNSQLSAGDNVVLVPAETVAKAKIDLALPAVDSYSPETLARLRKRLDCDYVVFGSFFDTGKSAGGRLQVQYRMQSTSSGDTIASAMQAGTDLGIADLAATVGSTLRSKLGLGGISMDESSEIQASIPSTPAAREFYSQGLAQLQAFDFLSARDSFQKAIAADPNFSLAHGELAEAWKALGYDQKAEGEAKAAMDLSAQLSKEDRTLLEARYREMANQWSQAIDLYRSLWIVGREQTPEYAYRAADVQIRAGKANDALATVAALRKQPGELGKRPGIDLREAEAYESLGDSKKEAAAAQKAAEGAHSTGARLLEAEALWRECGSLATLGQVNAALAACRRSADLAKATGDLLMVARSLTNQANISMAQNDFPHALSLHRDALKIARQIGSQRDVTGALTNIGDALSAEGDHPGALQSYLQALPIATDTDDQWAILKLQNDLAIENQFAGDFPQALDHFKQSLNTSQAIHNQEGAVDAEANIGSLEALRGDLAAGAKDTSQALRQSDALGLKSKSARIHIMLGDILLDEGDLAGAQKEYSAALDAAKALSDNSLLPLAQLSLAALALENSQPSQAEVQSRQTATAFHSAADPDDECSSLLVLARSLIDQKKYPEAAATLQQAAALKRDDPALRLTIEISSGRLLAYQRKFPEARQQLAAAALQAKKLGLRAFQLESSLAEAELGLLAGDKASATATLRRVQQDAATKGYRLIEKRAATLRERAA